MTDADKIKMTINIGGELLQLTVPFKRQDTVRNAENAVRQLYENWRGEWPSRSQNELLAMVAFQFASLYQELIESHRQAFSLAEKCEQTLDKFLIQNKANPI